MMWELADPMANCSDHICSKCRLLELRTFWYFQEGQSYLDALFQEAVTPQIRDTRIREVNTWLQEWCGKEGFLFMGHWHQYWNRRDLHSCDGLHLNRVGTNVLAKR
eukprot:g25640.t1